MGLELGGEALLGIGIHELLSCWRAKETRFVKGRAQYTSEVLSVWLSPVSFPPWSFGAHHMLTEQRQAQHLYWKLPSWLQLKSF